MKKIFKIFLVLLIAINFVFTNTVKTKAANGNELRFYYMWKWENQNTYVTGQNYSNWIEPNSDTVAYGISLDSANAIYDLQIYFDIPDLETDETLELSYEFELNGIRPNIWGVEYQAYVGSNGTWRPIYHPNDNSDAFVESINFEDWLYTQKVRNYRYTNTYDETFTELRIDIRMDESRNILYLMAKMFNAKARVYPSDEKINIENHDNIKGIFGTVKDIFTKVTELPGNIANSVSGFFDNVVNSVKNIGNQITNGLTTLGNFIIDGLKSLFIPSDTYFKNYFDSLYDFFSEKLGILIMPIDILGSLMDNILNLGNGDGFIHVPDIKFMNKTLIPKTDYNLKQDVQQVMGNYYDMYYLLTDVIIYFMLFNMAKNKFDEIVRGTK